MDTATLLQEAQAMKETLANWRRTLHQSPETGFDLTETKAYVKQELEHMGYTVRECGRCGLVASAGEKKEGKVFLLRADMDALPIKEEAAVSFAATNGNMHACGHDMHTAMLLGAAKLLKEHETEINGTVKLMFQAAEEIFEGSHDMIVNGVLKSPEVDAALMLHVMAGMPFPSGTAIVSSPGVSAPAADLFEITVQGKGCHGSMPNTGIDPLNAAAHILLALQEIGTRELAIHDSAVLTIGKINGGIAPNVIPDTVQMGGSLRTFDEEVRAYMKKRIVEIAEGIAKTFRATASVAFTSGCPVLKNDRMLSGDAERYARELLGAGRVFTSAALSGGEGNKAGKTAGSEDFAYVSHEVPSIMLALAAGQPENGHIYPQHHPMVTFDEAALPYGSAIHAYSAMRWLEEHTNPTEESEKGEA